MRRVLFFMLLAVLCLVPDGRSVHARRITAPCQNGLQLAAGVRLALQAIREADPALRPALEGCAQPVSCGSEPSPTRTACTMQLMPEEWGYRVTVRPRAADGVPAELRVNVDTRQATTHVVHISRNRWAMGAGVAIVGVTEGHIHTHGGPAARIGWASFRVWNDTGAALPLTVFDGVFLHDSVERPLANLQSPVTSLPPGESQLRVGFASQEAYQGWNDHFAARVRLRAGNQVLAPQAEFSVSREEPWIPDP